MGSLADMLAAHTSGDSSASLHDAPEGDEVDDKKLAEESVKAFFAAGRSGDFAAATEHLMSAITHCQNADYDPEPDEDDMGGGDKGSALLIMPHGKK